jgi:hypothetical protein
VRRSLLVLALIPFLFFPASAVPVEVPGAFVYAAIAANDADASVSVFITPSESVAPGTLVKLDASKSDAETFLWTLASDDQTLYDVANDGRTAYFSCGTPGTYTFILSVAKSAGEGKPPVLKTAKRSVVVKGAAPGPGPVNPDPQPQPVDPLPAGKFGLGRMVRDLTLKTMTVSERLDCAKFSANYSVVSSQIAAGTITTLAAANAELQKRNQATARGLLDKWKENVFTPLGGRMSELVKQGALSTTSMDDLRTAFTEISAGFAAASGN